MRYILYILICFSFLNSYSQNDIGVKYDYDAVSDLHVRGYNYTDAPIFLKMELTYFFNTVFNGDLPFIQRLDPGSMELFVLNKYDIDQGPPTFEYSYKWYMAHPDPDIDPDFPYLFPVELGSTTETFHISTPKAFMGTGITGKWYSLGFPVGNSQEIMASRKGMVIKVIEGNEDIANQDEFYQLVSNSVRLLHDDGTIAEYTNFATNGVYCEIGETVFPGQPLGKVGKSKYVGLTVFHSDIKSKYFKVIIPKFYVKEEGTQKILAPGIYVCDHPIKVRGLEMTKKQRKKILGAKKQ